MGCHEVVAMGEKAGALLQSCRNAETTFAYVDFRTSRTRSNRMSWAQSNRDHHFSTLLHTHGFFMSAGRAMRNSDKITLVSGPNRARSPTRSRYQASSSHRLQAARTVRSAVKRCACRQAMRLPHLVIHVGTLISAISF
jgi:hypothetical protein